MPGSSNQRQTALIKGARALCYPRQDLSQQAHLEQLVHNIHMPGSEANVDGRWELEGIEVPSPLRHQVVDLVDVDATGCGLEGHHTHLWLAYHPQALNLGDASLELLGSLRMEITCGALHIVVIRLSKVSLCHRWKLRKCTFPQKVKWSEVKYTLSGIYHALATH